MYKLGDRFRLPDGTLVEVDISIKTVLGLSKHPCDECYCSGSDIDCLSVKDGDFDCIEQLPDDYYLKEVE